MQCVGNAAQGAEGVALVARRLQSADLLLPVPGDFAAQIQEVTCGQRPALGSKRIPVATLWECVTFC